MKTRAIVIPTTNSYHLADDVETPPLGAHDVHIKTRYTSVSAGTERMLLAGAMGPIAGLHFPLIPGYETVGEIVECGDSIAADDAAGLVGKMAFVGGVPGYPAYTAAWGGQAADIVVSRERIHLLDGITPDFAGVALAPAATAWHGIARANIQQGDLVVILGQGPIGSLAAQVAQGAGARLVVGVDTVPERLRLSPAMLKVDPAHTDLKEALNGDQIDVLIDATGKMEVLNAAIPLVRQGARVVMLGFYRTIALDFGPVFTREITLLPSREWAAADIPASLDAMRRGTLDPAPLFTHRLPIERLTDIYDIALNDPTCLKVLIEW